MMVDPHGYYLLYVSTYDLGVYGYTIDFDTGALSPVPGSPFHALNSTRAASLAMDPQSKFLYVGMIRFGYHRLLDRLGIRSSGIIRLMVARPGYPFSMAVDPTGKFLYATDVYGDRVFGYIIDAATGALTGVFNSPFATGDCR